MNGPRLPATIVLPTTLTISAAALRTALGASKQCLSLWRTKFDFPISDHRGPRSLTRTADVAAWSDRFGAKVIWS